MKKNVAEILDTLELIYPDAECELNYTTPFELLIATILSAQCTDVRVNIVTGEMFKNYNTPKAFSEISVTQIEEMIKTCGLFKTKAKKIKESSEIILGKFNGEVPRNLDDLISLPGVGRKTANVVLSNAFGVDSMAVDTHVFRVSNRIGFVKTTTPEKTEFELIKVIPKGRLTKTHHTLIFHGRRCCKAKNPTCDICIIKNQCDFYVKK
ncbi:MAG: endonuclease III [Peptostreptococcaceae bacterium]